MSKQIYDSLTPDQQQLVRDAARETVLYAREMANQRAQNRIDILEANNTEILNPSDELRAQIFELSRPVYDSIREVVGNELVDALLREIEAVR